MEQLRTSFAELKPLVERQSQTTTVTLTEQKNNLRSAAVDQCLVVARRLSSAAKRLKLPLLLDGIETTETGMNIGTEQDQVMRMNNLVKRATDNLGQLADYGITETVLNTTKAKIAEFEAMRGQPTARRKGRAADTAAVEESMALAFELLEEDLMQLVESLEEEYPDFVRLMRLASKVRRTGKNSANSPKKQRAKQIEEMTQRNMARLKAEAALPTEEKHEPIQWKIGPTSAKITS